MTTRLYRSTDSSAPTLSGTVGDLVNLLDKCLVTGYGSQVAAGWTKPFTSTNSADFRGSAGLQYYIEVNDNGPNGTSLGKEARIRGYETMSAFNTGTNLFPTAAQAVNGTFVRKSSTLDAVVRPWVVLADERTFYVFVLTGDLAAGSVNAYLSWGFGDFYTFKSADLGNAFIHGRTTENNATAGVEVFDITQVLGTNATSPALHIARDAQNNVGAIAAGKLGNHSFFAAPANGTVFSGSIQATNPANNRLYLAPIQVIHTTGGNTIRGRMRGIWHCGHPVTGFSDGDTYSGAQDLNGRSFLFLKLSHNSGIYCLETSNTWDTN